MSVRRSSLTLGAVGTVVVIVAVLLRFVFVPILTRLPGSTDLHVSYAGTGTLLNSTALASGDTAHVIASNVPVTVDREVKVTSTHGKTAIVTDDLTVHAGGQNLPNNQTYALDRTTLAGTTPPAGTTVAPSVGALSSAFPIGPKADGSYRFYDSTTQLIVPVAYQGSGKVQGRSVRIYTIKASGPVKDPGVLAELPPSLPKKTVGALAPILPAAIRAKITPATLAALPDPIPLSYTGTTTITAYVDQQTGVPIDEKIDQQVVVNLVAGSQAVSLIPVLALSFEATPASQQSLAHKASTSGRLLTVLTVVAPIVLAVLGLLLIAIGYLRRRKPTAPAAPEARRGATHPVP